MKVHVLPRKFAHLVEVVIKSALVKKAYLVESS